MSKLNIDLAVRRAQADVKAEAVDLLSLKRLPVRALAWNIIVEPMIPKTTTAGGLFLVDESVEAEQANISVGRVLHCGPTAMQGKTNSGIEIKDLAPDIQRPSDLIGKYVIFQKFVGQTIRLRKYDDRRIIAMAVTELLCVLDDPEDVRFYL